MLKFEKMKILLGIYSV